MRLRICKAGREGFVYRVYYSTYCSTVHVMRTRHGHLQEQKTLGTGGKARNTTAYPRRHETPFRKRNSLLPFAESRFSQPLYE